MESSEATRPSGMKILFIGPSGSGKTSIANYLASGSNDTLKTPKAYSETKGVRILECERNLPGRGSKTIELWDVSGSSFESGWPACMQHADGVVLIYNPDKPGNDAEVGDWFQEFVAKNPRLASGPDQCLVLAHHYEKDGGGLNGSMQGRHASKTPAKLKAAGVSVVDTGYDSEATTVLAQNFDDLLLRCSEAKARA